MFAADWSIHQLPVLALPGLVVSVPDDPVVGATKSAAVCVAAP
ncbi:MAG: hypothetical protein QOF90_2890, partial [Acetobacteraceae bacterium]|nr:hypothetical protein [Acetobacteraceae bacterium]